jgi:hypothetical protein
MKARAGTPWLVADRTWFERRPGRSYRLRRPFPGEWETLFNSSGIRHQAPPSSRCLMPRILVWQLFQGVRLRAGVQLRRPLGNDEATAPRLFHQVLPIADLNEAERADFFAQLRAGDNCQGCGRPFSSGETTLAGTSHTASPLSVGLCCLGKLGNLVAIGGYLAPGDLPDAALAAMPARGRA